MTCGSCVSAIESNLKKLSGIESVSVALLTEQAIVIHDEASTSVYSIIDQIDLSGFDATLISSQPFANPKKPTPVLKRESSYLTVDSSPKLLEISFKVGGMTCASCSSSIETQIKKLDGVHLVSVALLAGRCKIRCDADAWTPDALRSEIEDLGFDAEILSATELNPTISSLSKSSHVSPVSEHRSQINIMGISNIEDARGQSS